MSKQQLSEQLATAHDDCKRANDNCMRLDKQLAAAQNQLRFLRQRDDISIDALIRIARQQPSEQACIAEAALAKIGGK